MIRLRSICRSIATSPLVGVLLMLGFAGAVGCTLAPPNHPNLAEHSNHWVVPPAAPCPPAFRAAEEPRLVRESFHPYSPVAQCNVGAQAPPRARKALHSDHPHPPPLPALGPPFTP